MSAGGGAQSVSVPRTRTTGKAPNVLRLLRSGYEAAVRAIIRPPMAKYELTQLGPGPGVPFCLDQSHDQSIKYVRTDAVVENERGQKLHCSHWEPVHRPRKNGSPVSELDCVVYLHGNSSCRAAVMEILPLVLSSGATCFAFDAAGCGKSEGQWVTLGHWEKEDLTTILRLLKSRREKGNPLVGIKGRTTGKIALYGRSMGASTAIMVAGEDKSGSLGIAAVVADSPFSDLRTLIDDLLAANMRQIGCWRNLIPSCLLSLFVRNVRGTVLQRTGMDLFDLRPTDYARTAHQPFLAAAGENDHFVHSRNAKQCIAAWAGPRKKLVILPDCDHNTRRPPHWFATVRAFLDGPLTLTAPVPGGARGGGGAAAAATSPGSAPLSPSAVYAAATGGGSGSGSGSGAPKPPSSRVLSPAQAATTAAASATASGVPSKVAAVSPPTTTTTAAAAATVRSSLGGAPGTPRTPTGESMEPSAPSTKKKSTFAGEANAYSTPGIELGRGYGGAGGSSTSSGGGLDLRLASSASFTTISTQSVEGGVTSPSSLSPSAMEGGGGGGGVGFRNGGEGSSKGAAARVVGTNAATPPPPPPPPSHSQHPPSSGGGGGGGSSSGSGFLSRIVSAVTPRGKDGKSGSPITTASAAASSGSRKERVTSDMLFASNPELDDLSALAGIIHATPGGDDESVSGKSSGGPITTDGETDEDLEVGGGFTGRGRGGEGSGGGGGAKAMANRVVTGASSAAKKLSRSGRALDTE